MSDFFTIVRRFFASSNVVTEVLLRDDNSSFIFSPIFVLFVIGSLFAIVGLILWVVRHN